MTFKIDYRDGDILRWSLDGAGGVAVERDTAYAPRFYVAGESAAALSEARGHLSSHPAIEGVAREEWRTVWREDPEPVLRLEAASLDALADVAREVRGWGDPAEYRLFNVDFAREFRYCLENDVDPVPADDAGSLSTLALELAPKPLDDGDVSKLRIDGEPAAESGAAAGSGGAGASEAAALDAVAAALAERDPDVLVVSSGELVPLLYRAADRHDRPGFELGRLPGWQQLAAESTFESYGRVGHSPARYNVFGRAIVDASNSFFWRQTNLEGLLDLVGRARKPLQETAWASIGNVLTSIQIRTAMDRGVLVPWNSWRHEQFKPMSTLHDADRGGFIFAPDVGVHEDVHELDFSSLYPNVMRTRNVSPDTIRCECHRDRADVPGLGYSVCDEDGFVGDVLGPIVDDRDAYKAEIAACEDADADRAAALQGRADALKWILVSCFGYQGFSNAKFGRIECHEAINAFAREILLDTKERLEAGGWEVVHGIVDSVWVRPVPGAEQTPLPALAARVTEAVGIELEYEAAYDWIAFVPRADSDEGALNRYFGKLAGGDDAGGDDADEDGAGGDDADEDGAGGTDAGGGGFKTRGIEVRQRSTPPFVEACQREWLEALDAHREPAPVCDRLRVQLADLRAGRVDPADLVIRRRVSKDLEGYDRATRNVAALERADARAFSVAPGQDVEYVVVDDDKRSAARVRLAHEPLDRYDADFYATLLVRAAESVISPFGWDRNRIRRYLEGTEDAAITAY